MQTLSRKKIICQKPHNFRKGILTILIVLPFLFSLYPSAAEIPWEQVYGGFLGDRHLSGLYLPGMMNSKPAFTDIDGDGDYDFFVGQGMDDPGGGTIIFFRNIGTKNFPSWATPVENYNNIDTDCFSSPAFVDIDADGDQDLFVGPGFNGPILFYENTGTPYEPIWADPAGFPYGADSILNQSPSFVDIDADKDYDLFVGIMDGTLTFHENTGTSKTASWAPGVDDYNGIDVQYICSPAFADIDGDRDFDMFVGGYNKEIVFYENIGSPTSPKWAPPIENYGSLEVGGQNASTFTDIDGDGDLDLFVGDREGNAHPGRRFSANWVITCFLDVAGWSSRPGRSSLQPGPHSESTRTHHPVPSPRRGCVVIG